ncbi:hypothetical protein Y032_0303g1888 [Ancylostoma ceylanicum]|uniref:Uncharacterized protein n=1 Tax=Ancylostoma ceylanicum TaxID=53326 RepID=A0A016S4K2_9BILA|nr:hypothetical protein Y032_0303g1888 [Ancylostoma ceylanicum]
MTDAVRRLTSTLFNLVFSTSTTASAPSTTAQTPLAFGTSLTTPLSTASGGVSSTEPAGADAASKLSLKGLLEKEGSVGSACSQLLAALTADTEISFADLSALHFARFLLLSHLEIKANWRTCGCTTGASRRRVGSESSHHTYSITLKLVEGWSTARLGSVAKTGLRVGIYILKENTARSPQ